MWREERDQVTARRLMRPAVITVVLGLGSSVAVLFLWPQVKWLSLPLVLSTISRVVYLHLRFLSRYHCPRCGRLLPRYQEDPDRANEVRFLCRECNVMWLTGVPMPNH